MAHDSKRTTESDFSEKVRGISNKKYWSTIRSYPPPFSYNSLQGACKAVCQKHKSLWSKALWIIPEKDTCHSKLWFRKIRHLPPCFIIIHLLWALALQVALCSNSHKTKAVSLKNHTCELAATKIQMTWDWVVWKTSKHVRTPRPQL